MMHFLIKLLLISTLLLLPLWLSVIYRWPSRGDLLFYATILKFFSEQFWSGDLYPRWLTHTNDGLGSPVFIFYPPLTFYIASLWQWLASTDPTGMGRVLLSMQLAIFVSGLTSYRWLKHMFPPAQAMKGALIYAAFPMTVLIIDFDFGVSQLWALAWFPLLLNATRHLSARGWPAIPQLSLNYALLVLTNIPALIVFAPIPILYTAFLSSRRSDTALLCILASVLGVALAAFTWLPAFANMPFIAVDHFLRGEGDFHLNFWKIRNAWAAILIFLSLAMFFLEFPVPLRKQLAKGEAAFWIWVIIGAFFMTSCLSYPLWVWFLPLHYLQFPWRVLLVAIPASAYLLTGWLPQVKSPRLYWCMVWIVVLGVGLVMTGKLFFDSSEPLKNGFMHNLFINREYETVWMERQNLKPYYNIPVDLHNMPPAKIISGKGTADAVEIDARHVLLHVDITSPIAIAQLRRFYFPGWISDQQEAKITESSALLGVILPKGQYDITLSQPEFAGEYAGKLISLIALAAWLILFAATRLRSHRKPLINNA